MLFLLVPFNSDSLFSLKHSDSLVLSSLCPPAAGAVSVVVELPSSTAAVPLSDSGPWWGISENPCSSLGCLVVGGLC